MKRIYLDYAALTPTDPDVIHHMDHYYDAQYGNPSALYTSGRNAARALEEARAAIAHTMSTQAHEIIFTGSGTESDNLALIGAARAYRTYGNHIIISSVEHKAVKEAAAKLAQEGFSITYAPVDEYGMVDIDTLASLIQKDTILISIMLINNEIGTVLPLQKIAQCIKAHRQASGIPLLHTDACQAPGHHTIDVTELGVDLLSLNGTKIYGPKGIGMLYKKDTVRLHPLIVGGGQEHGLRSGTESVPLACGLSYALTKITGNATAEIKRLRELRTYFIEKLKRALPHSIINGHPTNHAPHIVHTTIPGIEGESVVLMLDQKGIEVSTGSACASLSLAPSHVLYAIGHRDALLHGSIRFSFGKTTTKKELDYTIQILTDIAGHLSKMSAINTHLYAKTT